MSNAGDGPEIDLASRQQAIADDNRARDRELAIGWTAGRFRKRPVVIEAVQFAHAESAEDPFWRVTEEDAPPWLVEAIEAGTVSHEFRSEDYWYFTVRTLEGLMTGGPDDWLIRGVEGELYPCKASIFEATYEPAE